MSYPFEFKFIHFFFVLPMAIYLPAPNINPILHNTAKVCSLLVSWKYLFGCGFFYQPFCMSALKHDGVGVKKLKAVTWACGSNMLSEITICPTLPNAAFRLIRPLSPELAQEQTLSSLACCLSPSIFPSPFCIPA